MAAVGAWIRVPRSGIWNDGPLAFRHRQEARHVRRIEIDELGRGWIEATSAGFGRGVRRPVRPTRRRE